MEVDGVIEIPMGKGEYSLKKDQITYGKLNILKIGAQLLFAEVEVDSTEWNNPLDQVVENLFIEQGIRQQEVQEQIEKETKKD
jgi:hypothetical protein